VQKRRLLVVGGKWKHVPKWANTAFVVDLYEKGMDDNCGGRGHLPEFERADAVVISADHLSHTFSTQAHKLARKWGVPAFVSSDGWSRAIDAAARCRCDWFVDAAQRTAEKAEDLKTVEAVDNAWRDVAGYEREKTGHSNEGSGRRRYVGRRSRPA
jgi:hypothetical protein